VNKLNSPERERLLNEYRCNQKFNEILNYFENRVFFVDLRQEEKLDNYSYGSTKYLQYKIINDMIWERKLIVYEHLSKFIDYFYPERFDCENMKTMRDILLRNDTMEKELNELRSIVLDIANEGSTARFYDLLRFMPITNMFVNVFGKS
jgi:hypothetical protein